MNDVNNLLQRAKNGDDQALGALLEMYRNYLNILARLQIEPSLRGKLSSSDLVQETFLNAKRGLAGFRGQTERELMAWLRRIMANRLTDGVRHYGGLGREKQVEQRIGNQVDRSSMSLCRMLPARDPSPSDQFAQREQEVLLADALETLPEAYREVLVLRHLEGLKFADVAQQMGVPWIASRICGCEPSGKLRCELESIS